MLEELNCALLEMRWLRLLAYSAFAPDCDALAKRARGYLGDPDVRAFGWDECGLIVVTAGPRMVVRDIAVEPAFRRRGVGRQMIDACAEAVGAEEIVAETDGDAVEFYRRCGFAVESLGDIYRSGGCRYRCTKATSGQRAKEPASQAIRPS